MKYFLIFLLLTIISSCSFDTKTGIWNSEKIKVEKKKNRFKDFETLYSEEKTFNEIINPLNNLIINLEPTVNVRKWTDEFFTNSNNFVNFKYTNTNQILLKSKKLSKHEAKQLLYKDNLIFFADSKGNILAYSKSDQSVVLKYNFYKKKYKKIKKILNIFLEDDIIYISDNLGFVYSVNFINKKLVWAQKFNLPFRSNIKIEGDKIFLSDLNNTLFILNKFNGEKFKSIPTEEVLLKNDFISSLAEKNDNLFYLNTYGSLYSIDKKNLTINWFKNLNKSLDSSFTNLFYSNSIIIHKDKIIVSTDPYLYVLNSNNGSTVYKKPISSILNPIISNDNVFLITKDNLLVCINLTTDKINYSINIDQKIAGYLNSKKKNVYIKSFSIVNNNLYIFLENSYLIKFTVDGKIKTINKLKYKINTSPIFVENSIMYLNKKNQLIILN